MAQPKRERRERINPRSSNHKEKNFFFFCFVSIQDGGCSLNLL